MRSRCLRKYRSDVRIVLLVAEYLHGAAAGLKEYFANKIYFDFNFLLTNSQRS